MTQENKQVRIVMRKVAPGALRAGLKRNIEKCEFQYAMSSRRMLELLSAGKVAETDEILEWMQDYKYLRYLNGEIHTTGTPGTTTARSTTSD